MRREMISVYVISSRASGQASTRARRLAAFRSLSEQYLNGVTKTSDIQAGLYTVGLIEEGMTSREAEHAALQHGVETTALDRFRLRRKT